MENFPVDQTAFMWTLEVTASLLRVPFQAELAAQQFAAPHDREALASALVQLGIQTKSKPVRIQSLKQISLPALIWLGTSPAIVLRVDTNEAMLLRMGEIAPITLPTADMLEQVTAGGVTNLWQLSTQNKADTDPDQAILQAQNRSFGFRWFVPELRKHKKLWQEIFLASLVIQLVALATPLFTQTIIDKVIVNRTQSTLVVLLLGMAVFIVFTAVLGWLRQYLVLHTGNRVDAVLGAAVFERLFKLPPMYFQHRATGVISARLHGVETIREFIASTAVTLILDFPFLLIFVAIMLYYSVTLTAVVIGVLLVIGIASFLVAPMFQRLLQEQFQQGARNQAFITEYVGGLETVKSLQLEPQLASRYRGFLASYLVAGFATKQLANTYNTFAQMAEQIMNLLILGLGAWAVMHDANFTIGM